MLTRPIMRITRLSMTAMRPIMDRHLSGRQKGMIPSKTIIKPIAVAISCSNAKTSERKIKKPRCLGS